MRWLPEELVAHLGALLTLCLSACALPYRRSKKKGTPTASADNTDEAPSQSTTDTSFSASTSPEDSLDLDLDLDLNETASPSSHQSPPAPPPPPAQVALDFALLDPALAALDSQRPASSTTTSSVPLPPARFTNTSGLSLPRPSFVAPAAPPPPFLAESQARTALQPVSRSSAAVGVEMRTGAVGGTKAGTGAGVKAGKTAEAMRVSAEQQAAIALVGVGCAKSAGEKGR